MIENEIRIPKGWDSAALSEITSKLVDGSHNPPPKQADGFPMLSAINIANNKINFSSYRLITKSSFELEDCRTRIKTGDVLLTIVGAIGRTAVVPDGIKPFTLQRSVAVLTPIVVDPKFLMYQIESPDLSNFFMRNARGTAQKGIYLKVLGGTEILIPPFNEQRRIVAKIEGLFSELDNGIENLKTAREQLKVYRQAVLKHAFEGKLTACWRENNPDTITLKNFISGNEVKDFPELPKRWLYTQLGEVIEEPKYGTSKKCDYDINGIGVLRIPNIVSGVVDSTDLKFANFDVNEISTYSLHQGDILTIRSNGSVSIVGKCALVREQDEKFLYAGYLIRLRPNKEYISPEFLNYVLSSHLLRTQIERKAKSTSGVNNINAGELQSLIIPICGTEEQEEVVKILKEKLSIIERFEETIEEELQRSEALRQSILKKAFSGKLVAQDSNDEPASVLLERIRAEKEGQKTDSKKPKAKRNAA